jgi:hypothetical protein
MLRKMMLCVVVAGVSIASAKTYTVTLSDPYTLGATRLQPGDYRLVVNGTTAVLTDWQKNVHLNGTVATEAAKFEQTAVISMTRHNNMRLQSIQLGGTHLEVDFK